MPALATTILNPFIDNHISQVDPSLNFGTQVRISLRNTSLNNTISSLLTFEIPSSIPSVGIITANFFLTIAASDSSAVDWSIHRIVPVWSEIQSTWLHSDALINPLWTTAGALHVSDDISLTPTPITGTMPGNQSGEYLLGDIKAFVSDAIIHRSGKLQIKLSQDDQIDGSVFQFRSRETVIGGLPRLVIVHPLPSGGYPAMSHFNLVTPKII